MALFDEVFNPSSIYEMFFFNVKGVLLHPTLADLKANDEPMYKQWKKLSKEKYYNEIIEDTDDLSRDERDNEVYRNKAVKHPEFCKIVAITYASLYSENGEMKREFKKIANMSEAIVIETFITELALLSSSGTQSTPTYFPSLCGHNIIAYDIPLLLKRFIALRKEFVSIKTIPFILKKCLNIKPWESGIIDTLNVWKFNGFENTSISLISDFLGLKKTVDLLSNEDLSGYYWDNIFDKEKETLAFISLQSATQTNLVIQLMNELRQL